MTTYSIRSADQADGKFLGDMVVEAVNWRRGAARPRVEVLAEPEHSRYVTGWMRPSDAGFVAVDEQDAPIGAAWYRLLPADVTGFNHVGTNVPELVIGVRPIWRAHGVVRTLLHRLSDHARQAGYARISLNVEHDNFAASLYKSEGFAITRAGHGRDIMVKRLR